MNSTDQTREQWTAHADGWHILGTWLCYTLRYDLPPLVDEVHAEEVQYHAAKHEVCERPVGNMLAAVTTSRDVVSTNMYLSCDMLPNSLLFSGFVCIRKLAVSTN